MPYTEIDPEWLLAIKKAKKDRIAMMLAIWKETVQDLEKAEEECALCQMIRKNTDTPSRGICRNHRAIRVLTVNPDLR